MVRKDVVVSPGHPALTSGIETIAHELSVDWIVEGSARRSGDRVALTVQLVRAADWTHVFARRYDVPHDEIFDVERSVAHSIGEQIGIIADGPLTPAAVTATASALRNPTQDLVAYHYYIQGRQYLDQGPQPEIKSDPFFDRVRADERYDYLLRKMNLE